MFKLVNCDEFEYDIQRSNRRATKIISHEIVDAVVETSKEDNK